MRHFFRRWRPTSREVLMSNFRAWSRVRIAQKALMLHRMASAWQILQIGQRSIVARVLKRWRARAVHQRQGIIRKLMAFSEVRQSRAEALRRQDTFDMLRAGIETQIQQRRQRAIAQVHSQRRTFRWVADTILKRHEVYRWAKGSVAAHVQLVTQVLSHQHVQNKTDAEWRAWQLSVQHFPFWRRESLVEIWRAWHKEAVSQLRLEQHVSHQAWYFDYRLLRDVLVAWHEQVTSRAHLHQSIFCDARLKHCLDHKQRLRKVLIAWREFSGVTAPKRNVNRMRWGL